MKHRVYCFAAKICTVAIQLQYDKTNSFSVILLFSISLHHK